MLAEAIETGKTMDVAYKNPYMFPRIAYMTAANASWVPNGKSNGLTKKEMYKQGHFFCHANRPYLTICLLYNITNVR